MISGIGWVSELIEAAGGIDVFPAARRAARTPRTASSRAERRDRGRARHHHRLLVRQEIRAGEGRGAAGLRRASRRCATAGCARSNRPLILQPGPAALTDGLDALAAIIYRMGGKFADPGAGKRDHRRRYRAIPLRARPPPAPLIAAAEHWRCGASRLGEPQADRRYAAAFDLCANSAIGPSIDDIADRWRRGRAARRNNPPAAPRHVRPRPAGRRFRRARRASPCPARKNRRAVADRARAAAACRRRSGRAPAPFPAAPADRRSRPRAPGRPPAGVRISSSRTTNVGRAQFGMSPRRRNGLLARHRIADDLARQLAGQVELDAARQRIAARQSDMSSFARPMRHGPALHQQRHQHDHEGDVEIKMRCRQPDQQRDRGQENADRAAQAHPGDEQLLAH